MYSMDYISIGTPQQSHSIITICKSPKMPGQWMAHKSHTTNGTQIHQKQSIVISISDPVYHEQEVLTLNRRQHGMIRGQWLEPHEPGRVYELALGSGRGVLADDEEGHTAVKYLLPMLKYGPEAFFADILDHSGREVDEQRTLPAQCPDGDHMPIVFHAMDEGLGRSLLRMLL